MQPLLCNYLTNRNQYTECNGIESKMYSIYCGVPSDGLTRRGPGARKLRGPLCCVPKRSNKVSGAIFKV